MMRLLQWAINQVTGDIASCVPLHLIKHTVVLVTQSQAELNSNTVYVSSWYLPCSCTGVDAVQDYHYTRRAAEAAR